MCDWRDIQGLNPIDRAIEWGTATFGSREVLEQAATETEDIARGSLDQAVEATDIYDRRDHAMDAFSMFDAAIDYREASQKSRKRRIIKGLLGL